MNITNWSKHNPGIFQYNGKYIKNWFSNMTECTIYPVGAQYSYPSVEHFYQAMKSGNVLEHSLIAKAETAYEAKQMGKVVDKPFEYLIDDENLFFVFDEKLSDIDGSSQLSILEKIKLTVMYVALYTKFELPEWKEKLLATGDEQIIEWNNWGDRFWGVDVKDNKGQNWLGKLLMQLRNDAK